MVVIPMAHRCKMRSPKHMYIIFHGHKGFPRAEYLVQRFCPTPAELLEAEILGTSATIQGARLLVPNEAGIRRGRTEDDDPHIVERWQ